MSQPIHFVNGTNPGTSLDSSQIRALRSHVRRVNLERSSQKSTQRLENFRSLTVDDFSETGKARGGRRKQSVQLDGTQALEMGIGDLPLGEGPVPMLPLVPGRPRTPISAFQFLLPPGTESLPGQCKCHWTKPARQPTESPRQPLSPAASPVRASRHSYASKIAETLGLDEGRIASLLDSCTLSQHQQQMF